MACFSGVIRSKVLAMDTGVTVILPYDRPADPQPAPCPAVYLLHGLGDNHAAWTRYTRAESYAREKGVALIMPEVQRSFYYDMAHGLHYFTYITVELPDICSQMFHISTRREDTFVAGLSMGGYGAFKCGMIRPELYAGCASFSGAVDIVQVLQEHNNDRFTEEFRAVLGMDLQISDQDNLLHLAKALSRRPSSHQPALFATCGQSDFLHGINAGFRKHMEALPLDFTYREWAGEHNWAFWDESLRQMLELWL